jgi:hypothetical protein
MTEFSSPSQESAVVGYIATNGFTGLERSLCPGDEFTSDQWRPIYTAALRVHHAGRVVNQFTITEEIRKLGVSRDFEKLFPLAWDSWPTLADTSLQFCPPALAASCLDAIHEAALRREASKLGKELAEGSIDVTAATEKLQAIQSAARGESLESVLARLQFDTENPPPAPRRIYSMSHKIIATAGNLMVISGKAKSAKSAACSAMIAAATGRDGDTLHIDSENEKGHALIHIDTEQSDADHHLMIAGALCRVGLAKRPEWLFSYRLAVAPIAQRFDLLEHAIKRAKKRCRGIHSIIIDGVADLVLDPNDPAEAFATVERLHRLAIEHDTIIVCVIHVNPSAENGKTRGHLGSQLERKAESNFCVEKDEAGVSTIYSLNSRHAHISKNDGPRYRWDDAKGMHVSVESAREETGREASERLTMIAADVFGDRGLKYTAAVAAICKSAKVADKRAQALFSDMKKAGILTQDQNGFWEVSK